MESKSNTWRGSTADSLPGVQQCLCTSSSFRIDHLCVDSYWSFLWLPISLCPDVIVQDSPPSVRLETFLIILQLLSFSQTMPPLSSASIHLRRRQSTIKARLMSRLLFLKWTCRESHDREIQTVTGGRELWIVKERDGPIIKLWLSKMKLKDNKVISRPVQRTHTCSHKDRWTDAEIKLPLSEM